MLTSEHLRELINQHIIEQGFSLDETETALVKSLSADGVYLISLAYHAQELKAMAESLEAEITELQLLIDNWEVRTTEPEGQKIDRRTKAAREQKNRVQYGMINTKLEIAELRLKLVDVGNQLRETQDKYTFIKTQVEKPKALIVPLHPLITSLVVAELSRMEEVAEQRAQELLQRFDNLPLRSWADVFDASLPEDIDEQNLLIQHYRNAINKLKTLNQPWVENFVQDRSPGKYMAVLPYLPSLTVAQAYEVFAHSTRPEKTNPSSLSIFLSLVAKVMYADYPMQEASKYVPLAERIFKNRGDLSHFDFKPSDALFDVVMDFLQNDQAFYFNGQAEKKSRNQQHLEDEDRLYEMIDHAGQLLEKRLQDFELARGQRILREQLAEDKKLMPELFKADYDLLEDEVVPLLYSIGDENKREKRGNVIKRWSYTYLILAELYLRLKHEQVLSGMEEDSIKQLFTDLYRHMASWKSD